MTAIVALEEASDTEEITGSAVSIIKFLLAPSEPGAPGNGSVKIASTLLSLLMAPPFSVSEVVAL